ncbi:flagella basal body P-ring formation protein FlgA [Phyllobacterium phragmitis]|uniref:Flagella basal body P-ring formation protein FlgA n=1 Tax=Phyllobacterium phragmitis TaxID=2670329 RepID=A0A2S9IQ72_9HYPH|nr:flagellar basal body P-ring formation chaperone FlgA [Phyllobacterium phragmitis]PRD42674.1 flagella basal body P-ring formation protein FlgA [Phyllobacterium phragmitis]
MARLRTAALAGIAVFACASAAHADRISFVVPSAVIYPGQIVSDTALLEKRFIAKPDIAGQYALTSDQVTGKIARRTLLPGKPILIAALGEPSLVKRGVPAPLVYTAGGLTITAMGTPLEPGSAGDFIKVRNADSGLIVSGTILADGKIQVGMQ